MKESWIDLHVHSTYSDGILTPAEMIQRAAKLKLAAIGIADHDTIDNIEDALAAGKEYQVEVVPAVELSCQYNGRDVHILGYYFDNDNDKLNRHLKLFRDVRLHRAEKIVSNLKKQGIHIDFNDVVEKSKGSSVGRPHIAEVLMETGYVETFQEAFYKYIGYDGDAYVEKFKINPEEAIALINNARGLSFLAHPGPLINDEMIQHLIKVGLDGIEVIHPRLKSSRTQELQKVIHDSHLLMSGGSDCHGGRNGKSLMGEYSVPYAILEDMKASYLERTGSEWSLHES